MKFSVAIKNNYEFRRLYARGKSVSTPKLVVYFRKSRNSDENRLGITVGTKVGNAVVRNRVRRRIKEIYRTNEANIKCGFDIIIVARVKSRASTYWQLEEDFIKLCTKLGLWERK